MRIEYKKYSIELENGHFNLFLSGGFKIDKRSGKEIEVKNYIGYGFNFDSLIKRIILEELEKKKEVVTLNEFLELYAKEKTELLQVTKLID